MLDLTKIETITPKATYSAPVVQVGPEGLVEVGHQTISFVKGAKNDPKVFRQNGFTTETLLSVANRYLLENNVGDFENEYTTMAIKHVNKALELLQKRAADRAERGVQNTYQK